MMLRPLATTTAAQSRPIPRGRCACARMRVCASECICAHACGFVRACLFVVHRLPPALLQETISAYAELLYMWCVCLLACVRP